MFKCKVAELTQSIPLWVKIDHDHDYDHHHEYYKKTSSNNFWTKKSILPQSVFDPELTNLIGLTFFKKKAKELSSRLVKLTYLILNWYTSI